MSRILALDPGTKRIGAAVSDELHLTAHGLENIPARPKEKVFEVLQRLVREYTIMEIVIGLPLNMDGSSGASADSAKEFARQLQERLPLPVLLADERLTSAMAEKTLLEGNVSRAKRKELRDRLAAVLILQNHLDRKRSER